MGGISTRSKVIRVPLSLLEVLAELGVPQDHIGDRIEILFNEWREYDRKGLKFVIRKCFG